MTIEDIKMAKSYLRLDTRRARMDGSYPIKIAVSYGTNLMIDTGVSCMLHEWDEEKRQLRNNPRTNNLLDTMLTRVKSIILEIRDRGMLPYVTRQQLKKAITEDNAEFAMHEDTTFFEVADKFIATKKEGRTKELYMQTIKKVREFTANDKGALRLDDMKASWLLTFANFIGGSVNGQSIHLRNIRAIFNFALDEEITTFYPFRKFRIKHEETRKRALTTEQLRAYMTQDRLNEQDREYLDMFMLTIYLIGINIADMAALTTDSVRNGRLEYKRAKTGKLYSIKIEPEAEAIINRYKGKRHLLSPFDRYKSYKDYGHHLNDSLKRMGTVVGKHRNGVPKREPIEPDCSTYWARHTWATIAAELDIPHETIAASLGHSFGNKVTSIYIKFDEKKIDIANRKVIDYIMKNCAPHGHDRHTP